MLDFEILFDMTKNVESLKIEKIFFNLKQRKCNINAYDIHFGHIYKIQIPKNRPFYNSTGAKITKKGIKLFSAQILEDYACPKY